MLTIINENDKYSMKKILKEDFLDVVPEDELINKEVDDELSSDDEPKQ